MGNEKMRTFEFDGRRRGVRLDEGTWQAVDWLAAQRGIKWSELAREWVTLATHGQMQQGDNLTGIIRSAAMQCLLSETVFQDRADMVTSAGPIWQSLGMCEDKQFHEALTAATSIDGSDDFVGFKCSAGVNEFGWVTFYIENAIKECPSLIISTPFTRQEWEDKIEGLS